MIKFAREIPLTAELSRPNDELQPSWALPSATQWKISLDCFLLQIIFHTFVSDILKLTTYPNNRVLWEGRHPANSIVWSTVAG